MKRGKIYYVSRFFAWPFLGRWTVDVPTPDGPTAYVCNHKNMLGPLACQACLPFPPRPWVLQGFCARKSCEKQFGEYTFSQRYGYPRPVAKALAFIVSGFVSALVRSVGSIPVYRGTSRIVETFHASVEALREGDSVMIFPNVDYTDKNGGGELYEGFLLLDRFWSRESKEPLRFVPLRLDRENRRIVAGTPQIFDHGRNRKEETKRILAAVTREMS